MGEIVMIILTVIYVGATLYISFSNARSSQATRDQIKESQNQFIDANRAYVNINFEIIGDGLYVLKIVNNGNRIAKNVHVAISEEFVDIIENSDAKTNVQELNHSVFSIGIGQAWYVVLGSFPDFYAISQRAINIELNYSDSFSDHQENFVIDISQYGWCSVYDSPIRDIRGYMKSVSESVKTISQKKSAIA